MSSRKNSGTIYFLIEWIDEMCRNIGFFCGIRVVDFCSFMGRFCSVLFGLFYESSTSSVKLCILWGARVV